MNSDLAYAIWSENYVLRDCLYKLGIKNTNKDLSNDRLLSIIVKEAKKQNAHDVLEQLYFAGLIYSTQGGLI